MALKYNESTGEFEEKDGPRKPEPKVPPPFIYDPREHTVIPPKQEPREEKTKSEGGCLSTLLGLDVIALDALQQLGREHALLQELSLRHARVLGDTVQVTIRQQTLCQG